METKKSIQISAVIIMYNEEKNIRSCLTSICWADEIILVDAFSSDRTVKIARKFTDKIYFHKFTDFATQRNYALRYAHGKWILVLDADETLPDNAEKIIRQLTTQKEVLGYWLPRRNYINNKIYLKYGYFYPDYQLKLFQNRQGLKYEGSIHAQPLIDGDKTEVINKFQIYHNPSYSKYDSFFSFHRFFPYIRVEGKEMAVKENSNLWLFTDGFTKSIRFIYSSFIKTKGYKDGFAGMRAAINYGMYLFGIRLYAIYIRIKND